LGRVGATLSITSANRLPDNVRIKFLPELSLWGIPYKKLFDAQRASCIHPIAHALTNYDVRIFRIGERLFDDEN
jgi:hypothetical protein